MTERYAGLYESLVRATSATRRGRRGYGKVRQSISHPVKQK